jgi:hypothetical protein
MKNIEGLKLVFEEMREALKQCNSQAIDRIVSDEYSGFSLYGIIETKNDILDNFKPELINITEYSVEDEKYEMFGDIGIISGKGKISGHFNENQFLHNILFTDIFIYTAHCWKYYKSQNTEIKSA